MVKPIGRNRFPRKKGTQKNLPGMETPKAPVIEKAILEYCSARDERMQMLDQEIHLKSVLMLQMKKAKLTIYARNGIEARISLGDEKLKAKVKKEMPEEE